MNKETVHVEKQPPLNGERILSALRVAVQKIEMLQAIPELCNRMVCGDVQLETVLGPECADVLGQIVPLRQYWRNIEKEVESSGSLYVSLDGKQRDFGECEFDGDGRRRSENVCRKVTRHTLSKPVDEMDDISSQSSGIKKSMEKAWREEKSCEKSGKGKWDCYSCGMSGCGSKTRVCSCGVGKEEKGNRKKQIEKAVALLRNDSSLATFLRDVINASVTNVKSTMTHSHSHSQNIEETNEASTCASEESLAEQIVPSEDVSLQQHSMSTKSNNMMQLIRKALQSKYGDHTRRCIQDKDSKALLCILSLIDPEHYFALNPSSSNSNSVKGITNSQCDQSSSSLRSSHARHNNSNLNASQHHSNNHQPKHNHPNNLQPQQSTSLPTPQKQIHDFKSDNEKTETDKEPLPQLQPHSKQVTSESSTRSKKQEKKFNYKKRNEQFAEEMQTNKTIQESKRKWESQSQSLERVLETIEETEYNDQEHITNRDPDSAMKIATIPLSQDRFSQSPNHSSETCCPLNSNSRYNEEHTSCIPSLKKMSDKYLSEDDDFSRGMKTFGDTSRVNTLEDYTSGSISLGMGVSSDSSSTTGPLILWSKEFGVANVDECPKKKLMRLFRKLFNLLLFNIPALDLIKNINRRHEIKDKDSSETSRVDNGDQNVISNSMHKMTNGFDDSDGCSKGLIELANVMRELEEVMRDRLMTTFEEDRRYTSYCRELWIKKQRTQRKIEALKNKLRVKELEWKPQIAVWENETIQLKNGIKLVEEDSLRMIKMEIKTGLIADLTDTKILRLSQEEQCQNLLRMQQEYENLVENNLEAQSKFRARRSELELTLQNVIANYDVKMMKRQEMIDSLEEQESCLDVEINKLEKQFNVIDDKYSDMKAAKRLQEIMHGIEISNSFKKSWAAKRIQDAWRRYKLSKLKKKKRKNLKKKSSKAVLKTSV